MGGWWLGGWVMRRIKLKLNSTQVELVVEVKVELGKRGGKATAHAKY